MKQKYLYVIVLLVIYVYNLFGQIEKNSKGSLGLGGGLKNPHGSFGFMYGRSISDKIEMKLAIGTRQSPCLTSGLNFSVINNKKNIDCFLNIDYSYNFPGSIHYKTSDNIYDDYIYSEMHYIHSYISTRYYFSKSDKKNVAAIQLKLGYSYLINNNAIDHINDGPNVNKYKVNIYCNSGFLVGVDFLLFAKWSDVF